jgi:vacuolar-type H+-ATPase subunit I/STV1
MTADQFLQETIIDLQKQGLGGETRHLVEEAAQLLADGKNMEARALVEKAQAMLSQDFSPSVTAAAEPIDRHTDLLRSMVHSRTIRAAKANGPVAGGGLEQTIIARISGGLAQGITNALTEVIEDLHLNFGAQIKEVVSSLEDRLTEITSQLKALPHLRERVERIEREETTRASAAQERWDGLSTTVAALEEADRARRAEAEQFRRDVSGEMETISSRVTAQEERAEALNRLFQDLSPMVASAAEQIERHTELIRSMQERQSHRVAALNDVLDAIGKLREPKTLGEAAASG